MAARRSELEKLAFAGHLAQTSQDVIQKFLTETVVQTAGDGLLGVLSGVMCGPLFGGSRTLFRSLSPDLLTDIAYTLEPRIAPSSVVHLLLISLVAGVLSGVYPARQAAHIDPIEALRHES